jgi:hypothetical protein
MRRYRSVNPTKVGPVVKAGLSLTVKRAYGLPGAFYLRPGLPVTKIRVSQVE